MKLKTLLLVILLALGLTASRSPLGVRVAVMEDPAVYVSDFSNGCILDYDRDTREWWVRDPSGVIRFRGESEGYAVYVLTEGCDLLPDMP